VFVSPHVLSMRTLDGFLIREFHLRDSAVAFRRYDIQPRNNLETRSCSMWRNFDHKEPKKRTWHGWI